MGFIYILDQELIIDYSKLQPGVSMFIPCLDRARVAKELKAQCKHLRIRVKIKQVIENNIYGLRIWGMPDYNEFFSTSQ